MFFPYRSAVWVFALASLLTSPAFAANELTSARGGSGGATFLDMQPGRIAAVRIRAGKYVDSIQLGRRYKNKLVWGKMHGGSGGKLYTIEFSKDERIEEIGGRSGKFVDAIYIRTNKKTYKTRGGSGGKSFRIKGRITGIWGRSGSLLDAIGVVRRFQSSPTAAAPANLAGYVPASGAADDKADSAPSLRFPEVNTSSGGLRPWLEHHNRGLQSTIRTLAGNNAAFERFSEGERSFCRGNLYCEISYRQDAISFATRGQ